MCAFPSSSEAVEALLRATGDASNALIVTHGLMLRLFLMRWFPWSVEEFEILRNPRNGQVVVMDRLPNGKYQLVSELERRGDCWGLNGS